MGYSAELIMGSREHETLKALTEKSVTLRANRIKKSLDYSKVENPLYVGQHHELRENAGKEPVVYLHSKTNHNQQPLRSMGNKDDGPVKHMRNLPGYLQRVEKGENIQGKALNFGVLDWGRLENWKSNEKRIPPRYNMKTSPSRNNPTLSRTKKKIHPPRRDHQLTTSCVDKPPPGVRWPRGKAVKVQISEYSPCPKDLPSGSKELENIEGKQADQTSVQENSIEANERRLSDCFSPDAFLPSNPFSEVPHSCPFPLGESPVTPSRNRPPEEHSPVVEPSRRFSFSLGKMTRSLSFKESSSLLPQLPSTYQAVKSGPVNFEPSPTSHASRSSPLRRLLDPLLKLKGSHLAEKFQKPKAANELIQRKIQKSSNTQALLQLTLKNGIPFFKLVVESNSHILAAAVKKLPSGKDDSALTYAFYAVHETKKKGGSWIHQNSKDKSCRFGFNIIGHMNISSSYHAEFSGQEKDLYVVRESVLYEKTLGCQLDQELAAIIVKNPSDDTCGDIGGLKSTVVVLPDGVHGLPSYGQPSPLIDRWRSGGSCDCGGWDVGCRFRVISRRNETVNAPSPSNRLDLCHQGMYGNKCGLSLVALDEGLYSLEYEPSISTLQAFSICVALVSSQKLTHIFQVNYLPENPIMMVKSRDKYVSKPPASPVGRV